MLRELAKKFCFKTAGSHQSWVSGKGFRLVSLYALEGVAEVVLQDSWVTILAHSTTKSYSSGLHACSAMRSLGGCNDQSFHYPCMQLLIGFPASTSGSWSFASTKLAEYYTSQPIRSTDGRNTCGFRPSTRPSSYESLLIACVPWGLYTSHCKFNRVERCASCGRSHYC